MSDRRQLVVVGGGLAGLTAAVRAAELGLRGVLVLEAGRDAAYACNSRYTMGFFHVAFHAVTLAPAELRRLISGATQGAAFPGMAECIADNIGRGIAWLGSQGQRFIKAGPLPWMNRVLAPPRVRRTGVHWEGRGGDVLLRRLAQRLAEAGGELARGVRAEALEMREDRCVGVRVGGRVIRSDAVVLADGGFQANPDLVRAFISPRPEKLCLRNAGSGVGDGLRMAQEAGAASVGLNRFYGHVQCIEAIASRKLWPYPVLDHLCTAGIVVDRTGRRFADEGLGGVHIANAIAALEKPDSAVVVFDEDIWNIVGRNNLLAPNPGAIAAGARLFSSDSLEGLARSLDLPSAALAESVAAHNAFVSDPKAQLTPPRSLNYGPPRPIRTPPYHAFRACAGITYTMGGILIDSRARVLNTRGGAIPGLYAAGSTTGGLEGGEAAAYVGGLSKALVTGMLAAETAAASSGR